MDRNASEAIALPAATGTRWGHHAPALAALAAFVLLFAGTAVALVRQWWNDPDVGHGLLLVPVAGWLAWRMGRDPAATPSRTLGLALVGAGVAMRVVGALAVELFAQRVGMLVAGIGLVTFFLGARQVRAWWLPVTLLAVSIPLPTIVLNQLALPLQLQASRMGAGLLAMRGIPVLLDGNVISLPGRQLFVTEACSGLRSLTALVSIGILVGALMLRRPVSRILLLVAAVGVAVVVNAVRVFLTGYLVFFVSPAMGEGFMHLTEGWLLFVVSLGIILSLGWLLSLADPRPAEPAHA